VRFAQLCGAFIAANFNGFAADLDLDGISVQLAIASSTGCGSHHFCLLPEVWAQ